MFSNGDDAGHCSNALTAQKFREATPEERTVYRKWLRGIVLLYCTLVLVSGVAMATWFGGGKTQLTDLSVRQSTASARPN